MLHPPSDRNATCMSENEERRLRNSEAAFKPAPGPSEAAAFLKVAPTHGLPSPTVAAAHDVAVAEESGPRALEEDDRCIGSTV